MGSTANLTTVIRNFGTPAGEDFPDIELLDRYTRERDQTAFAMLVRRYGPLVLGVARRQLADYHRAEDVFQATFLALARSAPKLGGRPVLANWLYTVALRHARKARARDGRREALELTTPTRLQMGGDPLAEITARELLLVIDEELNRLPNRLRLPVLLCCIQGLSREEAAQRLGCSDAVVKGRLERGRRRLATRLATRGLASSALLLAPLTTVTVPADLLARSIEQAASPWAKSIPAPIVQLATTTAPRTLLLTTVIAGCVLAVGLARWGIMAAESTPGEHPPITPAAAPLAIRATPVASDDPLPTGATLRFGTSRFRHPTTIKSLAVSSDGTIAIASSESQINGVIRVYDLTTGRSLLNIEQELGGGFTESVAISPDSKTLAVKRNHSVYLYDATTGKQTAHIPYPSANPSTTINLLTFAPDGKHVVLAAAEGKALHLIGLANGKVLRTFPLAHVVFAAAFSPDGRYLVGGGYDSEKNVYFARLWDAESGKELHRLLFGNGGIRCVAYSPDGKTIAIGGDDGKTLGVKLFAASTGKEQMKIPVPDASSVRSVAFSPDGKMLAASSGSSTRLFDTATGKETLKIDRQMIGLRFSPDGSRLFGADAATISCWDTKTGRSLIPEGGESPVAQVEILNNAKQIVTRGQDGDAHIWDGRTGKHLSRILVSWQRGLALSPDGRFLVWPAADEKVQFKDPNHPNMIYTGSRLRMLELSSGKFVEKFGNFEGDAQDLFFTASGRTLVTIDHRDAKVRLWNTATGKIDRSFTVGQKGVQYQVWHSRLSPDGKVLAVTYQPAGRGFFSPFPVKLWDTTTGKELHDLAGHWNYVEAMAFSSDGKFLTTGSQALSAFAQKQLRLPADQVFVWEVATGKQVAQLASGATAEAFTPDGKMLVVAEKDGTLQFWDTAKWTVKSEFRGPRERVTTLVFDPDGQLLSGSVDATVLSWNPQAASPPGRK